jgi:hypothetical protein
MLHILYFTKSPIKNKKYRAFLSNNTHVDFGDLRYQHYKDSTPLKLYIHMDHRDKDRRIRYYLRHKKNYPKFSADWFSKTYLW